MRETMTARPLRVATEALFFFGSDRGNTMRF